MEREKQPVTQEELQLFRQRGYSNADILPKTLEDRNMSFKNYFTLWMGSIHNIPNYAAVLGYLLLGLHPIHVIIALILSGICVAFFLSMNGRAGTKYGIPFAMQLRSTYGSTGAKLPGFLRGGIAAIAWFGVQTFVGGSALTILVGKLWPGYLTLGGGTMISGISVPNLISFFVFWVLNMVIGLGGEKTLNKFTAVLSPLIYVIFGGMTIWALRAGGGLGAIFSYRFEGGETLNPIYAYLLIISSTLAVWAAPGVSISDFTQFSKTKEDQRNGQIAGLGVGYLIFAVMAVIIMIGGTLRYGVPTSGNGVLDFIEKWDSLPAIIIATGVFLMTTISTNATGNIIPAGYQLAALLPKKIDYKKGVWIAGIVSILIQPWRLMSGGSGILLFLDLIGALLGPVAGVMVAQYYLIQKETINLSAIYYDTKNEKSSPYSGVNVQAYIATIVGLLVSAVGQFVPALSFLARVAWIAGFATALVVYVVLKKFSNSEKMN